eukprot:6200946-Pleurochrysis_carterae.AAC.7
MQSAARPERTSSPCNTYSSTEKMRNRNAVPAIFEYHSAMFFARRAARILHAAALRCTVR